MDLIQESQKLSISIQKEDKIVEIVCTISKVLDDRLILELPPYFMRYIEYLDVGNRVTVKVFSKLGTVDFNAVIIKSPLEEEFEIELDYNALKLTPDSELPVIQVIRNMKIKYKEEVFNARTFEISTAYIKFHSDGKFNLEDNLKCELNLPEDYGTINFKATVTGIDAEYSNEYEASLYSMNEQDRETLLYYMYVYSNNSDQE